MRKALILASAIAGLLAAPMASAAPTKQLSPRQTALIMQLNRAHKGMAGAQHAGGNLALALGALGIAGLGIGIALSSHSSSPGTGTF